MIGLEPEEAAGGVLLDAIDEGVFAGRPRGRVAILDEEERLVGRKRLEQGVQGAAGRRSGRLGGGVRGVGGRGVNA